MDDYEIERHASNINFLSEWRYFNYEPKVIRFAPETGCSSAAKPQNEITLSQFTAGEVSKCNMEEDQGPSSPVSAQSRKDFILYAGGLVWALDWCPRSEQESESGSTCEFIAVAAHPPDSNYHKLGAPLSGRGMVQIWCLLNYATNEDTQITGSTKHKYKKPAVKKKVSKQPGRPRGRPRKNPINNTPDANLDNHADKDSQSVFASLNILDIAPLSECSLSTPHADKGSQHISASQNMSDPVYDNMQSQKNVIEKNNITYKRRKRKPRESTMDEALVDLLESQFIPPLNVQLPDTTDVFTFDENNTVPIKEKQKFPTRKVLENDPDFTIAASKMKSRKKSKFFKDPLIRFGSLSRFHDKMRAIGRYDANYEKRCVLRHAIAFAHEWRSVGSVRDMVESLDKKKTNDT